MSLEPNCKLMHAKQHSNQPAFVLIKLIPLSLAMFWSYVYFFIIIIICIDCCKVGQRHGQKSRSTFWEIPSFLHLYHEMLVSISSVNFFIFFLVLTTRWNLYSTTHITVVRRPNWTSSFGCKSFVRFRISIGRQWCTRYYTRRSENCPYRRCWQHVRKSVHGSKCAFRFTTRCSKLIRRQFMGKLNFL